MPERALQVNFHLFQRTVEDARQDPLGKNVCQLYTHYGKSSEAWKVAVVGIECDDAAF